MSYKKKDEWEAICQTDRILEAMFQQGAGIYGSSGYGRFRIGRSRQGSPLFCRSVGCF